MFQWFVLLSTLCLAGLIFRSMILSFTKPSPGGVASGTGGAGSEDGAGGNGRGVEGADAVGGTGGDSAGSGKYDRPPFYTVRQPVFWHIILLAALSRVILYGVGFLSSRFIINFNAGFFESLTQLWQRSDAMHFVKIAENWYVNTGEDRVFLVFLPFFPMLIRLLSYVFGSAVFSGIFLSLTTYFAACVLFYEIALLIGQDEDTAYHAVKYAVFFPASFFVNGAFSEGLFLLLTALFFHCLLRKKWAAAGCCGLLASFTRYYGLVLAIPYAIELLQYIMHIYQQSKTAKSDKSNKPSQQRQSPAGRPPAGMTALTASAILWRSAPILLIPAGTGIYLLINYAVSGNFFQFLIYQRDHWNQRFAFFFNNMHTLAHNVVSYDRATSASLFIPQIICIVLFIALMFYGVATKFRVSFMAYLGVYYLLSISAYWMLSFPRYIFGAVPLFSLMSSLGNKSRAADALVTLACSAGLIFLTIAYTCGFHVY